MSKDTSFKYFINEEDRIVVYDHFAEAVVYNNLEEDEDESDEYNESIKAFIAMYEVLSNGQSYYCQFMTEQNPDFGEGMTVMSVIRRKSDGRLFGFSHWANGGYSSMEPNGDDHDLEDVEDDDTCASSIYVWAPVEPFVITGYSFRDES